MEIFRKTAIFRADMAGLGKYHMGRYGQIRVYRVNFSEENRIAKVKAVVLAVNSA